MSEMRGSELADGLRWGNTVFIIVNSQVELERLVCSVEVGEIEFRYYTLAVSAVNIGST